MPPTRARKWAGDSRSWGAEPVLSLLEDINNSFSSLPVR